MASPLTVSFDLTLRGKRFDDMQAGFNALANSLDFSADEFVPVVKREMQDFLELIAEAQAQRHGNPWPGGTTVNSLSTRSGDLVQAIKDSVAVIGNTIDSLEGQIGGPFWIKVHEFGATIRPVRAKYLTVPLPAALNSNGTPKKRSARDWANTFIITSKKGNLLIVTKEGRKLVPLYVLKTSVYIPPRLNMLSTVGAGLGAFADSVGQALVEAMNKKIAGAA